MVPRAVIDVMVKRTVLVPKFVIKFHFMYLIAVTGNEGSAAESRPTCPGAAGGDRTAAGAGSTPECCYCLSQEEDSGTLYISLQVQCSLHFVTFK